MDSPNTDERSSQISMAASRVSHAVAVGMAVLIAGCSGDGATGPPTITLTVDKAGFQVANALVTSGPAGISCGDTCSAQFEVGTVVTLTATVAGSLFDGWMGAAGCSGMSCVVTLDQNVTITASYRGARVAISAGNRFLPVRGG